MKELEYHFRDKSDWHAGPWQDEPDKRQFVDQETGLPCLIVRNGSGALCGYVGVSEGHPLFAQDYSSCYEDPNGAGTDLDVHGGLTYSDFCVETDSEHSICHLVEPGENDRVWWLGFDCAHLGDLSPAYEHHFDPITYPFASRETYKTISYVEAECAKLAKQLAAMPA